MSDRTKKIFFALTVIVPFLLYCIYYYSMMIKNAPYRFSDFESMSIQYGPVDSLMNKYDSKTGDYQYVNRQDSVVKMHLHLTSDDLLYLHRKAASLGFWDFPTRELADSTKGKRSIRYVIEFKYKKKSKRVTFDSEYVGDTRLIDANRTLIKEIEQSLLAAEERSKK